MYGQYYGRFLGHFSEFLLNIFIKKIELEKVLTIKNLPIAHIKDASVDTYNTIEPYFANNYVPVLFCCSDYYVPYLMVVLQSLIEHSSVNHNYDIIIFTKDISIYNRNLLKQIFNTKNISIRFVVGKFNQFKFSKTKHAEHASSDCYNRLFAPFILKNYKKVICLDADILVKHDIYYLYIQELNDCALGACVDQGMVGLYNITSDGWFNIEDKNYNYRQYLDDYMELNNPYNYFNAGVFLFDLEKLDINQYKKDMFKYMQNKNLLFGDQDILNLIFDDKTKLLDISWNYMPDNSNYTFNRILDNMPLPILKEYKKAKQNPKIIHYAGSIKPWNLKDSDHTSLEFQHLWWDVARRSPLYEVILSRINAKNSKNETHILPSGINQEDVKNLVKTLWKLKAQYYQLKIKYIRYKILSKLGFSKKYRQRYKAKRYNTKDKINQIKDQIN